MIALVADANLETEPAKAESDCERPHKAEVKRPTGKGTDSRRNSKEVRDGENAAQEGRCPRIAPGIPPRKTLTRSRTNATLRRTAMKGRCLESLMEITILAPG